MKKKSTSSSKYRQQLKDMLSGDDIVQDIDILVKDNKTTYKAVYECLHYGLDLEETWFIIDTHRSLSFDPSIKSLRVLFLYLKKDKETLLEALEFLEEYGDSFQQDEGPDVEWFRKNDQCVYGFKKMLKEHNDSFESLKMHVESFGWNEGIEYE